MHNIALYSNEVNENSNEMGGETPEVKGTSQKIEELKAKYNDFIDDRTSKSLSLEVAETDILDRCRVLTQEVLAICLSINAAEKETDPVACPECDKKCSALRLLPKDFVTLCGEIKVNRWVSQCESGHRHAPWDAKQKLLDRYSRGVAETMCRLAAHLDFREAEKELSHHGIKVSHTTVQKKIGEWSEELDVCEEVQTHTLREGEKWYVSIDGCYVNSPDGWKETKVGCVYRDYPQPETGGTSSARTESPRYVAGRQDAKTFGSDLFALATNTGVYQEDIETQEVVFIGDGAAWIWNISDEHFPNAVEIVDIMHAKTHLDDVAKTAFGETETEKIDAWINEVDPLLRDGNRTEVVVCIRALKTEVSEEYDILEREARDFEKHANRMRYKEFIEKGYQIGSGVIESACKHVVAQRCKQAAMKWNKEGINAILKFRCLLKNEMWEDYWDAEKIAA